MMTKINFCLYLAPFFLEWKRCRQNRTEIQSTHFMLSDFFSENRAVLR
jgi:hypothetical protein